MSQPHARPSRYYLCVAVLAGAVMGCGQPAATTVPTAIPDLTAPTSTASAALRALAEEACLATEWPNCVDDVVLAAQTVPGSLVAICDFGNQTGDVVFIDEESQAESECAAGGTGASTRVVGVLNLP
jgi:hypothetical protein